MLVIAEHANTNRLCLGNAFFWSAARQSSTGRKPQQVVVLQVKISSRVRLCPCGCGKKLGTYNGHPVVMCYRAWQHIPSAIRNKVMQPRSRVEYMSGVREALDLVTPAQTEMPFKSRSSCRNR